MCACVCVCVVVWVCVCSMLIAMNILTQHTVLSTAATDIPCSLVS